jgi:hypothetical protein
MIRGFCLLILLLLQGSFLFAQNIKSRDVQAALNSVDTMRIRGRVIFLSHDSLRGRKPGSSGYQMAVDFAIRQFKSMGIEPKGDDGYLQHVVIRSARVDTSGCSFTINGRIFRHGKQVALFPDMNHAQNSGSGKAVWVGYGISAPHLGHDDYKSVDVRGKVVIMRSGAPKDFPASELAHFNNFSIKGDIAAAHGAIGIILLENKVPEFLAAADAATKGLNGFVNKDGTVGSGRMTVAPSIRFIALANAGLFDEYINHEHSAPVDLNITISAASRTLYRDIKSYNVVGWIPGTDPELKNEYVIHTAHLDHLGVGKPIQGDSIYNGAHDNASGTACALEIAGLYKRVKTKRSILIALVTAEEMGLLGSRYLATNPPVPNGSIVADVNTDMPTLIAPMLSIEPLGANHSTLINQVNVAAKFLDLEVQPDHMPEQVRFVRSDQYSFIRMGIPALHVKFGLKTKNPNFDLRKHIDVWTNTHYHKPSDEFRDASFNFASAATYVKLNFLIGYQVANTTERPSWVKGDFFGETFGKK